MPDEAAVAAARLQARRRLVGALVLLAAGVIGFPLLFETQPRPLPQDTPIVVAADALTMAPGAPSPGPSRASPVLPVLPVDAGVESVPAAAASGASAAPAAVPSKSASGPAPVKSPSAAPQTAPAAQAAQVPAVPTQQPPAAKPSTSSPPAVPAVGKWVVQVGAYNDMERLKAARARLQKLGYATYTQEVESSTGRRTRVRVGPFKTRAEADAVAARVKSAGMQAAVLSF